MTHEINHNDPVHGRIPNRIGEEYLMCTSRPIESGQQAQTSWDSITCPQCRPIIIDDITRAYQQMKAL